MRSDVVLGGRRFVPDREKIADHVPVATLRCDMQWRISAKVRVCVCAYVHAPSPLLHQQLRHLHVSCAVPSIIVIATREDHPLSKIRGHTAQAISLADPSPLCKWTYRWRQPCVERSRPSCCAALRWVAAADGQHRGEAPQRQRVRSQQRASAACCLPEMPVLISLPPPPRVSPLCR
jgi:hypothetical protein